MSEEDYDRAFAALLRQTAITAFGLSSERDAQDKLIRLYGTSPRITASIGGRNTGLTPRQTAALFTSGTATIFENQNGFLSLLFSEEKRTKKDGMRKMAIAFHEDIKAIDPTIAPQFGRNYEEARQYLLRNTNLIPALETRHRIG